jgi:hypothetical protein
MGSQFYFILFTVLSYDGVNLLMQQSTHSTMCFLSGVFFKYAIFGCALCETFQCLAFVGLKCSMDLK